MLRAMSTNLPEGASLDSAGTEASAAQAAGAGLSRMQRLQQLAAGKVAAAKQRAAAGGGAAGGGGASAGGAVPAPEDDPEGPVRRLPGIAAQLMDADGAGAVADGERGEFWAVRGCVRLAGRPAGELVDVVAAGGQVSFAVRGKDAIDEGLTGVAGDAEAFVRFEGAFRAKLTVEGKGGAKAETALKRWLLRCRPAIPGAKAARTRESLSQDEVAAVNRACAESGEELPQGFWFDGRSYMDHTGAPTPWHPGLEAALAAKLDEENAGVRAWNKDVKRRHAAYAKDMFC